MNEDLRKIKLCLLQIQKNVNWMGRNVVTTLFASRMRDLTDVNVKLVSKVQMAMGRIVLVRNFNTVLIPQVIVGRHTIYRKRFAKHLT